jgi:hypothetical protein
VRFDFDSDTDGGSEASLESALGHCERAFWLTTAQLRLIVQGCGRPETIAVVH